MLKNWMVMIWLCAGVTLVQASDFSTVMDVDHANKHYQGNWGEGDVIKNTLNLSASWTPGPWALTLTVPYQRLKYNFSGLIFQSSRFQRLRPVVVTKGQTVEGGAILRSAAATRLNPKKTAGGLAREPS